jgi:very-short-patch-repair endonuclease
MNDTDKVLDQFDPLIQKHIAALINRDIMEYTMKLQKCESPIESLFCLYFVYASKEQGFADSAFVRTETQKEININGRLYRVDFMLHAQIKDEWVTLIVETDGHQFHEKTKEQARNDKARERALKAAGYEYIRFTGSEVFDNPYKCVLETMEFMKELAYRKRGGSISG